eukprot:TRINITY_DN10331_c0_g1_i2.p1 TRINITY_DN10331_c0_g1~~TRINITY_DN10331_c0_g1_i2.p1  ORF type:complete len:681 (+),score=154.22 TRINITY_DN10331_c0_g1_i2:45-2045(+)
MVSKYRAWSNGVALHGPTALGVTVRQGGAKGSGKGQQRRRPLAYPAAADSLAQEGGAPEVEDAESQETATLEPELQQALLDRSARLVELLRAAEVQLPAGLPKDGKIVREDNALLFVARYVQMLRRRGSDIAVPRVAFHWTAESNFQSIVDSTLRVPDGANVKKKHGAAFGPGIYTSPDFHFAKEDFSYGAVATFMCLGLPGKQLHRQPGSKKNHLGMPQGFDSVVGRLPGRPCDTWVFPEVDQLLPCFLVDELALHDASKILLEASKILTEPWPAGTPHHKDSADSVNDDHSSVHFIGDDASSVFVVAASDGGSCLDTKASTIESNSGPTNGRWRSRHRSSASNTQDSEGSQQIGIAQAEQTFVAKCNSHGNVGGGGGGDSCSDDDGGGVDDGDDNDDGHGDGSGTLGVVDKGGGDAARPGSLREADSDPALWLDTSTVSTSVVTESNRPSVHRRRRWKAGAEDVVSSAAEAKGNVKTVAGSLLLATETFIAHQCCCVLSRPAEGVAASIFERFPDADVYQQRKRNGRPVDIPGTISVHRRVVNIYGQFCPGKPLQGYPQVQESPYAKFFARFPGIADTRMERLLWFSDGLQQLASVLPQDLPRSVAIPARIGCGLAAGHWPEYLAVVNDFAARANVSVTIYDNEAVAGKVSPATGQLAIATRLS